MPEKTQQLRGLADAAGNAYRSLETRIAHVDGTWTDAARRSFEGDHLAAIRADARHLRDELEEIGRLAGAATRQLERR